MKIPCASNLAIGITVLVSVLTQSSPALAVPPPVPPAKSGFVSPPKVRGKLGLQVGAGYNEQIATINNSEIAKSGVRWIRAYVNLPRNYFVFGGPKIQPLPPSPQPRYPITGVVEGNIVQEQSSVSSDADTLAVAAIDQLINTKMVSVGGQPVKVILSLKHDFSYPYPKGAEVPEDQFPDLDTPEGKLEIEEMVTAIENLLITNGRGNAIDILVTGNEPMFEIQPNSSLVTAEKYKKYLNYLIQRLVDLRIEQRTLSNNPNSWNFQIFVGALNSPLAPEPLNNEIFPAVLDVAKNNLNVDGVDLHEHVMSPSEVRADIGYVKNALKSRTAPWRLISTEFSIIRLLAANMQTQPTSGKNLVTFLNDAITSAGQGKPISQSQFLTYFYGQKWYPRGWFRQMINAFDAEGVSVVTYGLEEVPRYPAQSNIMLPTAMPWVFNGALNATLLGRSADGFPVTNPLVWPDFYWAVINSAP